MPAPDGTEVQYWDIQRGLAPGRLDPHRRVESIVEYWASSRLTEPELYLPQGKQVCVVARTEREEQVGEWLGCWHYLRLEDEKQDTVHAWAFGKLTELDAQAPVGSAVTLPGLFARCALERPAQRMQSRHGGWSLA
jgi:hypothetical protein